jgi:hypothetical protein
MTGGPRNRPAFQAGQRAREAIRRLMLEHARLHPLARPLTGKELRHGLRTGHGISLAPSTVYWHIEQIRREAESERWNSSNSLPDDRAA